MEFKDVISERRSIRKYQYKDVSDEKIAALIESARLCQSAKNRQPWKFMVLRGDEKDEITSIMLSYFEDNDNIPESANSSMFSANIIREAPVVILVFKDKDEEWETSDLLSVGAAIEHICLTAVDLGLGSVWIRDTAYTETMITHYVGYDELDLVSAIAVGYPDQAPKQRPRKTTEEIMIVDKIRNKKHSI